MKDRKQPSPHDRINIDEDDEMIVEGYVSSTFRLIIFCCLIILSCGTFLIIIAWKPGSRVRLTHVRCSLDEAQTVVLKDVYGEEYVESVIRPQHGLESEKCGILYSMIEGLSTAEAIRGSQLYGINSVVIEIKPIWKLIVEEITGPFYIYQQFIFVVWMVQLYYQFAVCVLLLSIISVSMHVWQTRKQTIALRKKVHSESDVIVIRDGVHVERASTDLVPGDVIIIPIHSDTFTMECDAVLISGSCTVDESMLSGESVPISKISLEEDLGTYYSPTVNKINTLFCGTQILHVQTTDCTHVKAIVIRTGFSTAKGELVRSILFPKPVNFKLKSDLIKCMGIFFSFGIPCMIYTAYRFTHFGASGYDVVIIVIDVATFLVPPLLPAVMTSINAHAQRRIRKKGIFCLNPNAINSCGGLDLVCFDKTGTLTEDSIDLSGVIPVDDSSFQTAVRDVSSLSRDNHLLLSMGACHSLTLHNGKVDGENLDLKLFDAAKWQFKDVQFINDNIAFEKPPERIVGPINHSNQNETMDIETNETMDIETNNSLIFGIIRQFPFESLLQRMDVIIKQAYRDEYILLMKGAPEVIESFCDKETIPEDFNRVLESYTRDGLRVIASASKIINANLDTCLKMSREELECHLKFDGLMVFQNCLKKETIPALNTLKDANIRSVMVTGDNILTAISVARICGMIDEQDSVIQVDAELYESQTERKTIKVTYNYAKFPGFSEKLNMKQNGAFEDVLLPVLRQTGKYHLAMEGKTFNLIRLHDHNLLDKVTHKGTIFARMLPEQKLHLIEVFQHQGHQVGMCGDGANDCGALRTAHAGVSLSVAESSVASPFTYREKNISCVPTLIREGRATLSATFGAFKYQVCYCFILLGAVLILFWDGSKPSDGAYVFVDIILNILPPMVFGTTEAYPHLVKRFPTRSILSFLPQFSMYSFIIFQIILYLSIRQFVIIQPWYEPFVFDVKNTHFSKPSHLAVAVFSVNMISYIISAIIFSPGPPFRKDIFSNKSYLFVVLLNFSLVSCAVLFPPQFFLKYINGIVFNLVIPKIRAWRGPIHKYEKIEQEIGGSDSWPPMIGIKRKESDQSVNDYQRSRNTTQSGDVWIMRSISNDTGIDAYSSPFNVTVMNEAEIDNDPKPVTFTTFMDGSHRIQHDKRDSYV